jgi:SAM-dependent methyltransferase
MAHVTADPGAIIGRQRDRFDSLWSGGHRQPMSADRIRFRLWAKYLVEPIVEVGSGDGLLARTFPTLRILSVDQSTVGLRATPDPRVAATLEHLPIRSGHARTIVAAEVLEHTGDPERALAECRRIARPDARLLLSVPTLPLAAPEALVARRRIGEWPTADNLPRWDPHHERRYDPEELLAQLSRAGWDATEVIPLFGTATTALLCIGEPITRNLFGRTIPLAQYGARLDRLWSRLDRHSSLAVVCRPTAV